MSGDWIKMRNNLWDDPRVSRLCDLTESREACVIGGLYWLWAMADEHTADGHLPGLTAAGIDRKTGIGGLGAALVEIGWLSETLGGVRVERFDEHNGTSAKRRSTDAQRKQAERSEKDRPVGERKCIPPARKARIFALDGFRCVYCSRHRDDPVPPNLDPSAFALSVDHLQPFSKGGDDSDENLVTACLPCNMSKNGRTPDEWGVQPDLSVRAAKLCGQSADKVRTDDGQDAPDGGRNAPKCGAREEKRREEKRGEGVGGVSESVGADGAQTTKGARLPKDWKLPKAWGEWAVEEFPHWTPDTVRRVAEGFRDHWTSKAGADARKTDWQATWRNWCRSDITQRSTAPARKTNGQAHHGTSYADRKDAEALNAAYLIGAIHRPAPVTDTIDHEDDPHAPRRLTS